MSSQYEIPRRNSYFKFCRLKFSRLLYRHLKAEYLISFKIKSMKLKKILIILEGYFVYMLIAKAQASVHTNSRLQFLLPKDIKIICVSFVSHISCQICQKCSSGLSMIDASAPDKKG